MRRINLGQGGVVFAAALASALAFTTGFAPKAEAIGGNVGAHAGYSKIKDAESGAVLVGGHGELRLVKWFGVQGAVDYRHVQSFDINTPNGQGELSVRQVPITVAVEVHGDHSRWTCTSAHWRANRLREPSAAASSTRDHTAISIGGRSIRRSATGSCGALALLRPVDWRRNRGVLPRSPGHDQLTSALEILVVCRLRSDDGSVVESRTAAARPSHQNTFGLMAHAASI
jgi:hypothetical protein